MGSGNYYHDLRILSLAEVTSEKPSQEYILRRILRWYSRTFSTPLHEVMDLPLLDVIQHYYESRYEEMSEEEIRDEIYELSRSPEEIASKEDRQKKEDEEFLKQVELSESAKKLAGALNNMAQKITESSKEKQSADTSQSIESNTHTAPTVETIKFDIDEEESTDPPPLIGLG